MKTFTKDTNILIIGLGVMGGSYASALMKKGYHVRCITERQEDIDYALAKGMIEEGCTEVNPFFVENADLIVFALYPHIFVEWIQMYQHLFRPGTLLTDVTGVKAQIVYKVQAMLRQDVEFISAHPMAGREGSGVAYSDDSVFAGANYIVVPTEANTPEAIAFCRSLGETLGFSKISELTPTQHDEMVAFLSQLTHCIAVALMNCNEKPMMEQYTGDSFRDLTRIAKINDVMWSELFLLNKEALLLQMDAFSAELNRFRNLLENEDIDGMRIAMQKATARRTLFDKPKTN